MPSGMTETQRTVFALSLLTYLCVDVKELPDASASKVFSPDKASASEKSFQWLDSFRAIESCSSLKMVGVTGFEPVTLRLSSACSNQLSYTPNKVGGAEESRTPDL